MPSNQVVADFCKGSSVESEIERCPAGNFDERFEFFQDGVQHGVPVTQMA